MSARAPKHAQWISAPAQSFDPFQRSYLGPDDPRRHRVAGISAKGAAELGKQGITVSDEVVRDLDIPVMQEALDLLDKVFWTADQLGVGPEVRAAVYAIRGAHYAGVVAGQVVGQAGAAAAASVFVSIGGVAALGAIGAVALALSELFGGGDGEAQAARVKRAQAEVLRLRDRLTIAELAAEQDGIAQAEALTASLPGMQASAVEHKAAAARAKKLAAFYRALPAELSAKELALFESLSNLARWTGALEAYGKLGQSKKDALDVMFGKGAPRLPYQLKAKVQAETAKLAALTAAARAERPAGLATIAGLSLLAIVGVYAAVRPAGAAGLARSAASKVRGAASAGVSKVKGLVP